MSREWERNERSQTKHKWFGLFPVQPKLWRSATLNEMSLRLLQMKLAWWTKVIVRNSVSLAFKQHLRSAQRHSFRLLSSTQSELVPAALISSRTSVKSKASRRLLTELLWGPKTKYSGEGDRHRDRPNCRDGIGQASKSGRADNDDLQRDEMRDDTTGHHRRQQQQKRGVGRKGKSDYMLQ